MLRVYDSAHFQAGHRQLHGEPFFDFELNRWLPSMDEAEVSTVVGRIHSISDWTREMIALCKAAESEGRALHASAYYRAAEFYMIGQDPKRGELNAAWLRLFNAAVADWPIERYQVPYKDGFLPVLAMRAKGPRRETLVIHGGFDSYKEEYFLAAPDYAAQGFDVVVFDGPGQGQAIRRWRLTMEPAWERPVAAVLDHMGIESCALMGFSLGGYLAPRAAAFEPRIKRVIVNDVLADFYAAFLAKAGPEAGARIDAMVRQGQIDAVNAALKAMSEQSETAGWAIAHGIEICGAEDGYGFLTWLRNLRTAPFSERITQDVLLLGAQEDHIVPISQWYDQIGMLRNVKSLTAQLFTRADHAHAHCHVGNTPLVLDFVITWLNFQMRAEEGRLCLPDLA